MLVILHPFFAYSLKDMKVSAPVLSLLDENCSLFMKHLRKWMFVNSLTLLSRSSPKYFSGSLIILTEVDSLGLHREHMQELWELFC